MPRYERTQARLIHRETGEEIRPGDTVTDFRGNEVTFCYISRLPEPGKSGKIILSDTPDNPFAQREYYPTVVGARIEVADPLDGDDPDESMAA